MRSIAVFDLVGPMAHFRKFYTNSSSLTYHVPPRTVLVGMIAALLGWSRDSYSDRLSLEKAHIGVALCTPVRTIVQTVNLLATDDNDWHGMKPRTQIPTEWVLPKAYEHPALLRYRVYFAHEDPAITEEVAWRVQERRYAYPLFLGVASCPAWAEGGAFYPVNKVSWVDDPTPVSIDTTVPIPRVIAMPPEENVGVRILRDRMPLDLNPDRTLRAVADVLWEDNGRSLTLAVRGRRFRLPEDESWHVFLAVGDGAG